MGWAGRGRVRHADKGGVGGRAEGGWARVSVLCRQVRPQQNHRGWGKVGSVLRLGMGVRWGQARDSRRLDRGVVRCGTLVDGEGRGAASGVGATEGLGARHDPGGRRGEQKEA